MSVFRRRSPLAACIGVVLLVCGAGPAEAQSPTTGALRGVVRSESGEALYEALVTLRDTASGMQRSGFTGRGGTFSFQFLAPGEYELHVERVGFAAGRLVGIAVRPGREAEVVATLGSGTGAEGVDVRRPESAALAVGRPGASQWLPAFAIAGLPAAQRTIAELFRLASTSDGAGSVEGLPSSLSSLVIDGTVFRAAAEPGGRDRTNAFALSAVHTAHLVTNGVDVEWGDAAGALLSVHTRRGGERTRMEGAGFWSGSAFSSASSVDPGADSFTDVQGGFVVRGSLLTDSARFAVGVEARQLETPLSSAWADTDAAADLAGHGAGAGLDLDRYHEPGIAQHRSIAGFARFDWSIGGRHQVEISSQFASMPDPDVVLPGGGPQSAGSDIVAGGTFRSAFGSDRANDLRLSVTRTTRELARSDSVPLTLLAAEALRFGGEPARYGAAETLIRVSDAIHHRTGSHSLKLGAGFTHGSYRYDNRPAARGAYAFANVADLIAGTGSFSRIEGPASFADWTNQTITFFAQDRWNAGNGVSVLIGARVDRETLPSNVQRDAQWFQLTGLANDDAAPARWRIAPRFGLTWDVGGAHQWAVHAGGGLYYDRVDPLLLAEWQTDDGSNDVRRAVGAMAWPTVPGGTGATAPRLTMLGPNFDAPRTARLSAGVTRGLGAATAVHVGGVFRRTENLPRRSDINLLQLPAFTDQYGRAVYGTLIQQGGLLTAEPGSSRRFTEYDEVAALSADGWSDHWEITAGLEHDFTGGIGVLARYTYGRTTDNWFGAAQGGWTMAPPAGLDDNWSEGSSDFDRPHRAVVGAVMNVLPFVRIATLYRMQSGLPFTPGFRPGVDANADQVTGNDPAFIDETVSGMDALVQRWSCLRASVGRVAARNSCRTDATHALDLSLSVRVLSFGSGSTSLVADVFDVLESAQKVPDAALYLIDPAASVVTDAVARTIDVPLLVNPDFGEQLVNRQSGRRIRLGISLNW